MLDRLLTLVVSVLLAFLVWLYARSRDQDTLDNVPIPVHITLDPGQAEQYDLEIHGPTQVPFSFMGPPSRVREARARLQHGELRVIHTLSVPENRRQEARYADTVRVQSRDLHAPPGVKPTVVEGQNQIRVTLHRLVERRLPVRLEHSAEGRVTQVVVEPTTVLVRGPQEILDRLRSFPTQSCTVPDRSEATAGPQTVTVGPVALAAELDGRKVRTTPAQVNARVTLQPRQKLYVLDDVPVQFLCPPNFGLRPLFGGERAGRITLRLRGPAAEEPPVITAYVDLSERRWGPGLYEERVKLHLPRDFQLDGDAPGAVSFQLVSGATMGRDGAIPEN